MKAAEACVQRTDAAYCRGVLVGSIWHVDSLYVAAYSRNARQRNLQFRLPGPPWRDRELFDSLSLVRREPVRNAFVVPKKVFKPVSIRRSDHSAETLVLHY